MKTFLLIGLVRETAKNRLFPKPLCTVQASNLTLAALQLGGHLHDPIPEDEPALAALLWPDMPSAVFRAGERTGDALSRALASTEASTATPEDLKALADEMANMLKVFERMVIGQIPAVD